MQHLYTIGYQRLTVADLTEICRVLDVVSLVDLRAKPVSRKTGWSRGPLIEAMPPWLRYRWMGDVLGGFPPSERAGRRVSDWKPSPAGEAALRDLVVNTRNGNVMAFCVEDLPLDCHRSVLNAALARGASGRAALAVTNVVRDIDAPSTFQLIDQRELQRSIAEGDDYAYEDLTLQV